MKNKIKKKDKVQKLTSICFRALTTLDRDIDLMLSRISQELYYSPFDIYESTNTIVSNFFSSFTLNLTKINEIAKCKKQVYVIDLKITCLVDAMFLRYLLFKLYNILQVLLSKQRDMVFIISKMSIRIENRYMYDPLYFVTDDIYRNNYKFYYLFTVDGGKFTEKKVYLTKEKENNYVSFD